MSHPLRGEILQLLGRPRRAERTLAALGIRTRRDTTAVAMSTKIKIVKASRSVKAGQVQIQSVSRAVALLLFVSEREDGVAAKEAAFACGLALPTAYHLLNTLTFEGFLAKDARRRYTLGPKAGVIAEAYLRQDTPPVYLLDALTRTASLTRETVYVSAWRAAGMRVLACRVGSHAVRVAGVEPGGYVNAHARAGGKLLLAHASRQACDAYLREHPLIRLTATTITSGVVLLAELERIRKQGYATDLEEFAGGVSCLSVPVVDSGVTIAALTVSAPTPRFESTKRDLLAALRSAAELR